MEHLVTPFEILDAEENTLFFSIKNIPIRLEKSAFGYELNDNGNLFMKFGSGRRDYFKTVISSFGIIVNFRNQCVIRFPNEEDAKENIMKLKKCISYFTDD